MSDLKTLRKAIPSAVPSINTLVDWHAAQDLRERIRDFVEKVDIEYEDDFAELKTRAANIRAERKAINKEREKWLTKVDMENQSHNIEVIDKGIADAMGKWATEQRKIEQGIEDELHDEIEHIQKRLIKKEAAKLAKSGQTDQALELIERKALPIPVYVEKLPGTMTKLGYVEVDISKVRDQRFVMFNDKEVMRVIDEFGKGAEEVVGVGSIKVVDRVIARRKPRRKS